MKKLFVILTLVLILQCSVAENTEEKNLTYKEECYLYLYACGNIDIPCNYLKELSFRDPILLDAIKKCVSYQEYHVFEISGNMVHHTIKINYLNFTPSTVCKNVSNNGEKYKEAIFDLSVSKNGQQIIFKPYVYPTYKEEDKILVCYSVEPNDKIVIDYFSERKTELIKFLMFELDYEFWYPFDNYTLINWERVDDTHYYTHTDKIIIPNSFVPVGSKWKNTCPLKIPYTIGYAKSDIVKNFSLSATYEMYLKEGPVNEELKKVLEDNGITLPADVKISKTDFCFNYSERYNKTNKENNTNKCVVIDGKDHSELLCKYLQEESCIGLCKWEITEDKQYYKIYIYDIVGKRLIIEGPHSLSLGLYDTSLEINWQIFMVGEEGKLINEKEKRVIIWPELIVGKPDTSLSYEINKSEYNISDGTGCYVSITFERTEIIRYFFIIAVLLISGISIYFLWVHNKEAKIKTKIYDTFASSFGVWVFQEGLNLLTPLTRPTVITLFDLTLFIPLIFIAFFYIQKHIVSFVINLVKFFKTALLKIKNIMRYI